MILVGQYDSPFVRRVGIALTIYDIAFEHRTWSAFGDADRLRALNPLGRVPTLALDDGTVLNDSHLMLDYLDSLVSESEALFPRAEPARHRALRVAGLAAGAADKAVSLFYEKRLHAQVSDLWVARCRTQVDGTLALMETERARQGGEFWFGGRLGHADIAVACALRFIREAHPGLLADGALPALSADAARLEALPVFQAISQPFIPPA